MRRFAILIFCFNFLPHTEFDLYKPEEKTQEELILRELLESENYENAIIRIENDNYLDESYMVIETYRDFIIYHD